MEVWNVLPTAIRRIVGPAIIAGFCILVFFLTFPLALRDRVYPQVLTGTLFVLALIMIVRHARGLYVPAGAESGDRQGLASVLIFIPLTFAYIFAWKYIGYWISTLAYIALGLLVLRERKWQVLLVLPTGITLLIYAVFKVLLGVPLPTRFL